MVSVDRAKWEFEEFLSACEYDFNCAPATISFYRKKVEPLIAWMQEHDQDLDANTLREFFRHLKKRGLTDNGRHAHLRAIRTWLNFLVRRKVIPTSPLVDADLRIRPTWRRPDLPRSDRLLALLVRLKADVFPRRAKQPDFLALRDYCLVLWYLETGARRREGLVALDKVDVDYGRAMTVQKVRRETVERPLFFRGVMKPIEFYLEERGKYLQRLGRDDPGFLWIGRYGEPLTADGVSQIHDRIRRRHGWEGPFHPQKLRAVAATLGALNGDRTMLELMMGWVPGSPVAKRYIQVAQEEEMLQLQAALSPMRTLVRLRRPKGRT